MKLYICLTNNEIYFLEAMIKRNCVLQLLIQDLWCNQWKVAVLLYFITLLTNKMYSVHLIIWWVFSGERMRLMW